MKRLTRTLCASTLAGAILTAGAVTGAPGSTAAAATKPDAHVYVVATKGDGWCKGLSNKVTYMHYTNFTTGRSGGDSGDNIVYVPVKKGVSNMINISVTCARTTPIGQNFNITPKKHQETWFVRIDGTARLK